MRFLFSLLLIFPILIFAEDDPLPVTVKQLYTLYIYPKIESPASVVSMNDSRISAEVSARIIEIPASVGDIVFRDAILARLNAADFELEQKRLTVKKKKIKIQINQAKSQLNRFRRLGKQNVSQEKITKSETDVRILELDSQEVDVAIKKASRDVDKCTIKAPFTGLVLERLGKVGEFVSPGKPLLRVLDVEHIEVSAQVQTKDIASLKDAKSLELVYRDARYPLKLRTVVDLLNERTRTQEVRLVFEDKHALPGTSGRLVWKQNQPHISPEYLIRRRGKLGVLTYANKKAIFRELENALEGRPVPISLPVKTPIIIKGRYSVKDGDVVKLLRTKRRRKK